MFPFDFAQGLELAERQVPGCFLNPISKTPNPKGPVFLSHATGVIPNGATAISARNQIEKLCETLRLPRRSFSEDWYLAVNKLYSPF
jgi:hypothetical protein